MQKIKNKILKKKKTNTTKQSTVRFARYHMKIF